jgi:PAS domain S-box-containing protein
MSVSPDRRLTEGEQLVLAAMHSADDAIVTMALDGTITHWNRAAEQLFGYSAREAIGTNIGSSFPAIARERCWANWLE